MTSACVHCAADLEEDVDGIQPTLCCARCCHQFQGSRGVYRGVSSNSARKRYHCSKGDLKFLNFTTIIDAANRAEPIHVYLEAEVEYLGQLRDLYPMKTAQELIEIDGAEERIEQKRNNALKEKEDFVERGLEAIPEQTATEQRDWLVGDYISHPFETNTTRDDFLERLDLLQRATAISDRFQVPIEFAFDFCRRFPPGDVSVCEEWSDKTIKVFSLAGHRILRNFEEADRNRLIGTPLEFSLKLFNEMKTSLGVTDVREPEEKANAVAGPSEQVDCHWSDSSFDFETSEESVNEFDYYTPTVDDPEGVRRYVAYLRNC